MKHESYMSCSGRIRARHVDADLYSLGAVGLLGEMYTCYIPCYMKFSRLDCTNIAAHMH